MRFPDRERITDGRSVGSPGALANRYRDLLLVVLVVAVGALAWYVIAR